MNDSDIAYLAGLFDGEGCLIVRPKSKLASGNYNISYHLEIGMTDRRPIDWCKQVTGKGNVYYLPSKKSKWSDNYRWVVCSKQAASIVVLLLPFLKVKREQAVLFLELNSIKSQYRRGYAQNFERQYVIMAEIAKLKVKLLGPIVKN